MAEIKKERDSNLELYRIIVMYFIVLHHYVVNSGIVQEMYQDVDTANSVIALSLGMWGKTGINCFLLITGYFMCKSTISLSKFARLLGQVYFYRIIFFAIFLCAGYECITKTSVAQLLLPVTQLQHNFTGCFIAFFLFIPFLNRLIANLDCKMHRRLVLLCLVLYTILDFWSFTAVMYNYVTWFMVLYLIASYLRLYPIPKAENVRFWAVTSIISILISLIIVVVPSLVHDCLYWTFIADSNGPMAVVVSVCTFMWFKNLKIKHSRFINIVGGSTFGVLLIHANSDAMRKWLWIETLNNLEWYSSQWFWVHILLSTITIFAVCIIIDRLRIIFIERKIMQHIDSQISKISAWLDNSSW